MSIRFIRLTFLLVLFSFTSLVSAEEEYWEYTFRPGDSIWNIAKEHTNSVNNWYEIQRINRIRQGPDRKIRPGTRIVIPVSMLKLQPTPAIVTALNGDVTVVRANGNKETAKLGDKLFSGDKVLTSDKQSLRMQFADQSELQVLDNSEVVLDKLSHHKSTGMVDTRVRLNSGSVNTRVEKQSPDSHYEIVTPAAITAVRGTAFRLSTDSNNVSRTEVTEGVVAVSAGDVEREVEHGYGIVAEKDKPLPEPVKLLDSPIISDNHVIDKTRLHVSWAVLDGAQSYRYQLASDEDFNKIVIDNSTKTNKIELDTLAAGEYYLRVRGVDKHKLEGVDATRGFEIKEPPPPPPVEEDDSYWKIIMITGLIILIL